MTDLAQLYATSFAVAIALSGWCMGWAGEREGWRGALAYAPSVLVSMGALLFVIWYP